MVITARVLFLTALVLYGGAFLSDDDWSKAREQFDRRNYKAALAAVDRFIADHPRPASADVDALRARCLLKLRRWDEGIAAMTQTFADHPASANDPELHAALAEPGLNSHQHKALAINHLRIAADLFLNIGQRDRASEAAVQCASAFIHFDQWNELDPLDVTPPSDWRESRRLQRRFAVKWLDWAIEWTSDPVQKSAAAFRKATLFARDLRVDDGDVDRAIALYGELIKAWPESREAPGAGFQIGQLLEQHRQDYAAAADQYRFVVDRYPGTRSAHRARTSLKTLTSPILHIGVDGPFLPGQPADLHVETRNIRRVQLRAYRVDLFDLVRRFEHPQQLDKWQPMGDAAAEWVLDVPDKGNHAFHGTRRGNLDVPAMPLDRSGAYVVTADATSSSGVSVHANTLVIVSRLVAVSKSGRDGSLVWAVDANSGQPVKDVQVLTQERTSGNIVRLLEGQTDDQGLFTANSERESHGGGNMTFFLRNGDDVAICDAGFYWYWWGFPNDYTVYSFTDRPIYRPDHVIRFKHILRKYDGGRAVNVPGKSLKMTVYDPRGEVVVERELTTNTHGSATGEISLPRTASLGLYQMQIEVDNRHVRSGQGSRFRVEEYRKPEYKVAVAAEHARYKIGEPVDVRIEAQYYFGSPVAGADVTYTVFRTTLQPPNEYPSPYPWYFEQLASWWGQQNVRCPMGCWYRPPEMRTLVTRGTIKTDDQGVTVVRIPSDSPEESADSESLGYRYIVEAEVTDNSRRTVTGSGSINVTRAPFSIQLEPQRWHYQPGDSVHVDVKARGPNGAPVKFSGIVTAHRLDPPDPTQRRSPSSLKLGELLFEESIQSDREGHAIIRYAADKEGPLRFTVRANVAGDHAPVGTVDVWVADRGGHLSHLAYSDIELVPDQYVYEIDENARILINTPYENAHVLFTVEADDLIHHRVVELKNGGAIIHLPITIAFTPNFYMTATLVHGDKVFQDRRAIVVPPTKQFLTVNIDAPSESFGPGDETDVTLIAMDHAGKPANAEMAVMMVDASLYAIQPEFRKQVQAFFYGTVRPHLVQTGVSFQSNGGYAVRRQAGGPFAMSDVAAAPMAKEGVAGAAEPEFAVATIRKNFPDSVLWLGQIDLGSDGRETVPIQFPDTLTTWRLLAVAVDDETRVGESSHEFVTRKDIIARLQTPRFLVERDSCSISVIARNELADDKVVRVSLHSDGPVEILRATHAGEPVEFVTPFTVQVDVSGDSEAAIDFHVVVQSAGSVSFTATVTTDVQADAIQVEIPVLEFGAETLLTRTGVIRNTMADATETVSFTLPEEMNRETPILEVHFSPTIAGVILDAIPYLIDYPYGCTEQTMSRFLPAVMTRHTLQQMGVNLRQISRLVSVDADDNGPRRGRRRDNPVFNDAILDDIVAVGVGRLSELQCGDGGWGWWRQSYADPYMSAYVVYGLAEARRAGVAIDASMLDRGVAYLRRCVVDPTCMKGHWRRNEVQVRTWMLFALSLADPDAMVDSKVRSMVERTFEDRDELTAYTRAMLAMILHTANLNKQSGIVVENLEDSVRRDRELETSSWGDTGGYYRWYDNGLESTSMVLRTLLTLKPDSELIPETVNWLVRCRTGARWHSTKDTAFALYALADYLETSGELNANMTVNITFDDMIKRSFHITQENLLAFDGRMIFAPRHLTPGLHTVRIEKQGTGHVYHATYVDYYTKQDPIPAAGQDIVVKRSYARLIPREVQKTRRVWDAKRGISIDQPYAALDYDREPISASDTVASGDLIEVLLEIDAKNDFEYIMIEDPKPAGCEAASLHSGPEWGQGFYAHVEQRDRHVAFFMDHFPQKVHTLTYRLRCETPGTFMTLPTRVEAMYSPYVRSNSASDRMVIKDR